MISLVVRAHLSSSAPLPVHRGLSYSTVVVFALCRYRSELLFLFFLLGSITNSTGILVNLHYKSNMEEKQKKPLVPHGILKKEKKEEGELVSKSISHFKGVTFALHKNEVLIFTPDESGSELNNSAVSSKNVNLDVLGKKNNPVIIQVGENDSGKNLFANEEIGDYANQLAIKIKRSHQTSGINAKLEHAYISSLIVMIYKFGMQVTWTAKDYLRFSEGMKEFLMRRYESKILRVLYPAKIVNIFIAWIEEFIEQRRIERKNWAIFYQGENINPDYVLPKIKEGGLGCCPNHGRKIGTVILLIIVLISIILFMRYQFLLEQLT